MAAKKGNKYAEGCKNSGRPIEYDRLALAKDIIEWVQDEDNWIIKSWRIKHVITRDTVMQMCRESKEFSDAYRYANDVIAERREKMHYLGDMKDNLYNKNLRVYDKDFDSQEKDNLAYEYALKEPQQTFDEGTLNQFKAFMDQISSLQSDRKMDTSNKSKE